MELSLIFAIDGYSQPGNGQKRARLLIRTVKEGWLAFAAIGNHMKAMAN